MWEAASSLRRRGDDRASFERQKDAGEQMSSERERHCNLPGRSTKAPEHRRARIPSSQRGGLCNECGTHDVWANGRCVDEVEVADKGIYRRLKWK